MCIYFPFLLFIAHSIQPPALFQLQDPANIPPVPSVSFELFTGSQLHIDIDPNWNQTITHYRVSFRPIERFLNDPNTESITGSWQKPVTIEFLEEMWKNRWENDLMGLCWEAREVRELSPTSAAGDGTD